VIGSGRTKISTSKAANRLSATNTFAEAFSFACTIYELFAFNTASIPHVQRKGTSGQCAMPGHPGQSFTKMKGAFWQRSGLRAGQKNCGLFPALFG
jgi:hypothetical protein